MTECGSGNGARYDEPSMTQTLSREVPLVPSQSALLFIDVQNFAAKREGAEFRDVPEAEFQAKYGWYFRELSARIVPNMQRLQAAFRKAEVEVLYTTIESLTKDGRDRSLDYKISGFNAPSKANEAAFQQAVRDVAEAGRTLFQSLQVRPTAHASSH